MKSTKIPFDLAMAKEIHEGRREGEIVTCEGHPVEILTFEAGLQYGDIVFILTQEDGVRKGYVAHTNGQVGEMGEYTLVLRVPDDASTFMPFYKVLVRDSIYDLWHCDFFSHMSADNMYACISGIYTRCIPYEGNEELVGTTNKPKNE